MLLAELAVHVAVPRHIRTVGLPPVLGRASPFSHTHVPLVSQLLYSGDSAHVWQDRVTCLQLLRYGLHTGADWDAYETKRVFDQVLSLPLDAIRIGGVTTRCVAWVLAVLYFLEAAAKLP